MNDENTPHAHNPTEHRAAAILMIAGILPFAALAVAIAFFIREGDVVLARTAAFQLVIYSAVILTFIGGVRWGSEIAQRLAPRFSILTLSILGSLVGWISVWVSFRYGQEAIVLTALAACFAAHFVWDRKSASLPLWYKRFRLWPTAGALLSLALASVLLSSS